MITRHKTQVVDLFAFQWRQLDHDSREIAIHLSAHRGWTWLPCMVTMSRHVVSFVRGRHLICVDHVPGNDVLIELEATDALPDIENDGTAGVLMGRLRSLADTAWGSGLTLFTSYSGSDGRWYFTYYRGERGDRHHYVSHGFRSISSLTENGLIALGTLFLMDEVYGKRPQQADVLS